MLTFILIDYKIYMIKGRKTFRRFSDLNIKMCQLYIVIASAAAVLLRTLTLLFVIDPSSGFVKAEYNILAGIIFISIVAAALLCFLFARSVGAVHRTNPIGSPTFKIASLLLALFLLYDTLFSSKDFPKTSLFSTLELIAAILATAYLVCFVITDFMGTRLPLMFSVLPIIFWFIRLVIIFISFSTLATIPDNLFELASICFILISSLQMAKSICLEMSEKLHATNFALFMTTAFICFVTALPRAIISLSGNTELLHTNNLPILTTLAAGIYFLTFAFTNYKEKSVL